MSLNIRDMKRRTALEMFEHESVFKVIFDVRVPGVLVPDNWMKAEPTVINLDVGRGLMIPVPDFVIDKDGIAGTFSFNHVFFYCRIPWDAVNALAVVDDFAVGWQKLGAQPAAESKPAPVRRFKVIEGGG